MIVPDIAEYEEGDFENDVYLKEKDLKEFLEILDKENKS